MSAVRLLGVVVMLLLPLFGAPAQAQTLEGRVLDGASREPLGEAVVRLVKPDGSPAGPAATTGPDGTFSLAVPAPGEYYLRAERLSYATVVDGVFAFDAPHAHMTIDVFLLPQPFELEGVRVATEMAQMRRDLRAVGFYDRAASGFGWFVGPEEIERRQPHSVSDLMRPVPGTRLLGGIILFNNRSSRLEDANGNALHACEPNVWVDGVLMTKASPIGGFGRSGRLERDDYSRGVDHYVNPHDIIGMEVYRRPSSTPLQWGGLNGSCGAIVIWTRRGPR